MKKIRFFFLIFGAIVMLGTSCDNSSLTPTIDESTINHKELSNMTFIVSFKAECPQGTSTKVLFKQRTNGTDETMVDAKYYPAIKECSAVLSNPVRGSNYAYYVLGYNSDGNHCYTSKEGTFDVPKNSGPAGPSVISINAHAPSSLVASDGYLEGSILTEAIEYSTDDEKTWTPVTENGFIRGLRPGKVQLRFAETPTTKVGKTSTIVVPAYKSNTDMDGDGGTSEGVTSTGPASSF